MGAVRKMGFTPCPFATHSIMEMGRSQKFASRLPRRHHDCEWERATLEVVS